MTASAQHYNVSISFPFMTLENREIHLCHNLLLTVEFLTGFVYVTLCSTLLTTLDAGRKEVFLQMTCENNSRQGQILTHIFC